MYSRFNQFSKSRQHALSVFSLFLLWCAGLLIGSVLAQRDCDVLLSLVSTIGSSAISYVGLFFILFFPILVSFCSFYFRLPYLTFALCFIKGITYSYCVSGLLLTFGSASTLMHVLILFSDTLLLVPLFWLWIRNIGCHSARYKGDIGICIPFLLLIYLLDIFIVSPFCVRLMNLL